MKARPVPVEPESPDALRDELTWLVLVLRRRAITDRTPGVVEARDVVAAEVDADAPDIKKARAAFDSLPWLVTREEQHDRRRAS